MIHEGVLPFLALSPQYSVLSGSYADRKPGPSGANYVGEKLPLSMSNA